MSPSRVQAGLPAAEAAQVPAAPAGAVSKPETPYFVDSAKEEPAAAAAAAAALATVDGALHIKDLQAALAEEVERRRHLEIVITDLQVALKDKTKLYVSMQKERDAALGEAVGLRDQMNELVVSFEKFKHHDRDYLKERLETAENDLLLRPLEPSEAERKLIAAKKQLRTARAEARHYKENLEEAEGHAAAWMEEAADKEDANALLTSSLLGLDYDDDES